MTAGPRAERPALEVLVIGAGIVGVSTAERLRRAGAAVTLIDRIGPGDPAQASYGNAGLIARAAMTPNATPGLLAQVPKMLADPDGPLFLRWRRLPAALPWIVRFLRSGRREEVVRIAAALTDLIGDSVDEHLSLAEGTPAHAEIRQGRYGYLYRDRAAFERDAFSWALKAANGVDWTECARAELLAEDPALGPDVGFAAVMRDHAWIADPAAYVRALAETFERGGGVFRRGEVQDLRPASEPGGRVSATVDGVRLEADRAVLAAGAWSARLTARLGLATPLESERGYHVMFREAAPRPPYPYMLADAKFVATPMRDGLRCAGLVEIGGLDAPPSDGPPALIHRRIRRLYPTLASASAETWLGHRPSTPDSLPYLGEHPRAPGVLFAFGAQHVGLTSGPKTGRLIADLALGRRPNFDFAPFRADRFERGGGGARR